jgi:hypothetical protein
MDDGPARLDQQISFTDPDSRSMATSARGSGTVGYKRFALWSGHCARVVGSLVGAANCRHQPILASA